MHILRADQRLDIRKLLTPEQREKLEKMHRRRMDRGHMEKGDKEDRPMRRPGRRWD